LSSTNAAGDSQQASPQATNDSEILKLLEKTKLQLDFQIQTNAVLNDRLAAKDDVIKAKDGLIAVRDEQLSEAHKALAARTAINTGDSKMETLYQTQLDKANAEIEKLRHPGFLKQLFSANTIGGAAIGYGACAVSRH
jgi:hypothetical protein